LAQQLLDAVLSPALVRGPLQSAPPQNGAGLEHVRVCDFVCALLHAEGAHAVHAVHAVKAPFTGQHVVCASVDGPTHATAEPQ